MQSGQGGIRWNSANNWIQLMDENKNWVNYRQFDPNLQFEKCAEYDPNSAMAFNYSFPYSGLYILIGTGESASISNFTSTAKVKHLLGSININTNSRYHNLMAIDANVNDTLKCTLGGYTYRPSYGLFYIGSVAHSDVILISSQYAADTSKSISFSNVVNRILIGASAGGNRTMNLTTDARDYYTNGLNLSCASTVRNTGSASISCSGTTGGAVCIADIQVVV